MFFNTWAGISRVVAVGALAYLALVLLIRISGKRTLSKMNAFDLVVTVALGSTLATMLLSRDVALAEGVTALALLVALQFLVARTSVAFHGFLKIVKAEPRLIFHRGNFLWQSMRDERVVEAEVRAAIRSQGIAALEDVDAVVLETDGSFSVVRTSQTQSDSALSNVTRS